MRLPRNTRAERSPSGPRRGAGPGPASLAAAGQRQLGVDKP